jgi:hypothetical protein
VHRSNRLAPRPQEPAVPQARARPTGQPHAQARSPREATNIQPPSSASPPSQDTRSSPNVFLAILSAREGARCGRRQVVRVAMNASSDPPDTHPLAPKLLCQPDCRQSWACNAPNAHDRLDSRGRLVNSRDAARTLATVPRIRGRPLQDSGSRMQVCMSATRALSLSPGSSTSTPAWFARPS